MRLFTQWTAIPARRMMQVWTMMQGMDGDGDCFTVAWKLAQEISEYEPRLLIAHGQPILQWAEGCNHDGSMVGSRYWHGWLEMPSEIGWMVADYSNGLEVVMKRTRYYRLGEIEPEKVGRWTVEEAEKVLQEAGHYGPWLPYSETDL